MTNKLHDVGAAHTYGNAIAIADLWAAVDGCEMFVPPIDGTQTDSLSALESSANNEVVNK